MIRWTTICVLLGSLLAVGLYDRVDHVEVTAAPESRMGVVTPVLSEVPALTSDWYCPIGSTVEGGYATHRIYVTNLADDPAFVTVETITEKGEGSGLRFDLDPRATKIIDLAAITEAAAVAAVVEVTGGEGVVGHSIESAAGRAEGPCLTDTSSEWLFAGGVTTRDAHYYLALMNPSSNAVVFDATFFTDTRIREPKELEKAVVPAKSVLVIDVADFVSREQVVSTQIATIRGHLAVERLQTFDGTLGPAGATLELGLTQPATEWFFASGTISEDSDNKLAIRNPTDSVAEIDVYLEPNNPEDRLSYGLLPRELRIDPGGTVLLDLVSIAAEVGLPLPYELGIRLESANGVAFVADRWHLSPKIDTSLIGAGGSNARLRYLGRRQDGDTGEEDVDDSFAPELDGEELGVSEPQLNYPVPTRGVAMTRGVETKSSRWVIPWLSLLPDGGSGLVIADGQDGAVVQIQVLVAGEWQPPVRAVVERGGQVFVPLDPVVDGAPVLVTADSPIVVEGQLVVAGQRHDVVPAIPTLFSTPLREP